MPVELLPLLVKIGFCTALGRFGDDAHNVALNMISSTGDDLWAKLPLPRVFRPLGEPNHDLNKALARAISRASREVGLVKLIRKNTDSLRELELPTHGQIEDFLRNLDKNPEQVFLTDTGNAALKTFLEIPSKETFSAVAPLFGQEALPGLPENVQTLVVEQLYLRTSAYFWDEIKKTPKAWHAYSAEVYREFRQHLKSLGAGQEKILEALALHERKTRKRPMPAKVAAAIDGVHLDLEKDFQALHEKLSHLLKQSATIKGDTTFLRRMSLAGAALLVVLVFLVFFKKEDAVKVPPSPEKIEASVIRNTLITSSHQALQRELAEAEQLNGNWQKRERLRNAAQESHQQRLSRVEDLVTTFVQLQNGSNSSAVLTEMFRILNDSKEGGIDAALGYLETKRADILRNVSSRTESARQELQPLLSAAQLAIAQGQDKRAEAFFKDILRPQNPFWPQAAHEFWNFLTSRGGMEESRGLDEAALASYDESLRRALKYTEFDTESWRAKRDLYFSHAFIGNLKLEHGDIEAASSHLSTAYSLMQVMPEKEKNSELARRDLSQGCTYMGYLCLADQDIDKAIGYFKQCNEILDALIVKYPVNPVFRHDLLIGHYNLGGAYYRKRDMFEAENHFSKSIGLSVGLLAESEGNFILRGTMANCYLASSLVALCLGNYQQAADQSMEGQGICENLVEKYPDRLDLKYMLSSFYLRRCMVFAAQLKPMDGFMPGSIGPSLRLASQLFSVNDSPQDPSHDVFDLVERQRNTFDDQFQEMRYWFEKASVLQEEWLRSNAGNLLDFYNYLYCSYVVIEGIDSNGQKAISRIYIHRVLSVLECIPHHEKLPQNHQLIVKILREKLGEVSSDPKVD